MTFVHWDTASILHVGTCLPSRCLETLWANPLRYKIHCTVSEIWDWGYLTLYPDHFESVICCVIMTRKAVNILVQISRHYFLIRSTISTTESIVVAQGFLRLHSPQDHFPKKGSPVYYMGSPGSPFIILPVLPKGDCFYFAVTIAPARGIIQNILVTIDGGTD
jgi:hypothetical protein